MRKVHILRLLVAGATLTFGLASPPGEAGPSPLDHLPTNVRQVSAFGERAVWSPDGSRIAFVHKTLGDAFEHDLKSGKTLCITCSFPNAGYFRVQYLSTGDFILVGPSQTADREKARWDDSELWVLRKDLSKPPFRLNQRLSEGVATSRIAPAQDCLGCKWSAVSRPGPGRYNRTVDSRRSCPCGRGRVSQPAQGLRSQVAGMLARSTGFPEGRRPDHLLLLSTREEIRSHGR